jgi:hypothetical protein
MGVRAEEIAQFSKLGEFYRPKGARQLSPSARDQTASPRPSPLFTQQLTLPPGRFALVLLALKNSGSTLTMLSARGVKVETVEELIAAGLATASTERAGRGSIEIKRVKITEEGRRELQ